MKILYIDTGLRFPDGHLVSSGLSLPPAFRRLGHEVTILGHRDLAPSLQQAIGAHPFFRIYTWPSDSFVGWLLDFAEFVDETVTDLYRAWREFGPADFIYVNTARPIQLAAIGLWLKECFPDQGAAPTIAVQLGTTPGLVRSKGPNGPQFALRDPSTVLHRYATKLVGRKWMEKLALVAVGREIAEEYSFIVDLPVTPVTAPEQLPMPRQRKLGETLTIGFIGHQRIDKGYEFLPELIPLLLRRHSHLRIIVQHSDPDGRSQAEPARMARVTDKLRMLAEQVGGLDLILEPAVGEAWFALIDRCDIVALPYEPANYTDSYSAIFGEALASGAVIVAPAGTTMANEIARAGGVGVTFTDWAIGSIAAAVGTAVDGFEDLAERAHDGGIAWRKQHGPDAYVSAVIEAAGLAGSAGAAQVATAQNRRRVTQAWRSANSQLLPDAILGNPQVHNGARLHQRSIANVTSRSSRWLSLLAPDRAKRNQRALFLNSTIETTKTPFCYALTFDVNTDMLGKLPAGSYLSVEAIVEVRQGTIGIAWIDEKHQLASNEEVIADKSGIQRVVIPVLSNLARRLMLRNVNTEDRSAIFLLKRLSVEVVTGVDKEVASLVLSKVK
jgi:hypothetical protein